MELTGEAMEVIGDYYAEPRAQAEINALPIKLLQRLSCHQDSEEHYPVSRAATWS